MARVCCGKADSIYQTWIITIGSLLLAADVNPPTLKFREFATLGILHKYLLLCPVTAYNLLFNLNELNQSPFSKLIKPRLFHK